MTISNTAPTDLAANLWSEATSGLSGRVRVEFEDLAPGLRFAIYLELRNHSQITLAVTNQPQLRAEVWDSAGTIVNPSPFAASGPAPILKWVVVPTDAYVGFRVDTQHLGVPTADHGAVLLAMGCKSWHLCAGKHVMQTTVAYERREDAPTNQWVDELVPPPIEVVVAQRMLRADG